MKREIAAVGRGDEMIAFSLLGAKAYTANSAKEAENLIRSLSECAVVFVSEPLCKGLKRPEGVFPVIVAVPVMQGEL